MAGTFRYWLLMLMSALWHGTSADAPALAAKAQPVLDFHRQGLQQNTEKLRQLGPLANVEPVHRALLSTRRRLFLSLSSIGNTLNDVGKAADDLAKEAADTVTSSFSDVQGTLGKATDLIETAVQECKKLLTSSEDFGTSMLNIFQDFSPLEAVFASSHGIIALITNKERMKTLVGVVKDLFQTSDDVFKISTATGQVADIFSKLYGVFDKELSKVGGRRLLGVDSAEGRRLVDLTGLLDNLHFDELNKSFTKLAGQVEDAGNTLKDVRGTLEPMLDDLEVKLEGRRLSIIVDVQEDHSKYSGAITQVVPTWKSLEKNAIDVCHGTHTAVKEVQSLQCRVGGFLDYSVIPGTNELGNLVGTCDEEADKATGGGEPNGNCPGVSHSESIRNALGESAFFIGVVAVGAEYAITYNVATRILVALFFFLAPGIFVGGFGYRYKDVQFWIEGFVGGFVAFATLISVFIVWTGSCGNGGFFCDWRVLLIILLILSALWATMVVRGQKCQVFFAGFDLGAILGGVVYLMQEYEKIFDAVLDPDLAKKEMMLMLTSSIVTGLVLGAVTLYLTKPAIVFGTAAIGAAMITVAILIICPIIGLGHDLGWPDLIVFLLLTAVGVVVQYLYTNPPEGVEEVADGKGGWIDDEEAKQEAAEREAEKEAAQE